LKVILLGNRGLEEDMVWRQGIALPVWFCTGGAVLRGWIAFTREHGWCCRSTLSVLAVARFHDDIQKKIFGFGGVTVLIWFWGHASCLEIGCISF
jgi:hypothetical protein